MKNLFETNPKTVAILLLRLAIGWHFLFEALTKLYNPAWTAKGYLMSSEGLFAFFFQWLGSNGFLMSAVDFINSFGMLLIGMGLLLGLFYKGAAIGGLFLLVMYYLAHPPMLSGNNIPTEGNYFLVDKVLIEAFAMFVLLKFPTNIQYGLDGLLFNRKQVENVTQTA
jgi:thiosulfate dehydrogenase (quinone) large subunit